MHEADKYGALPADKQVEAVAAKLQALNPGFDGRFKSSRIDQNRVTFVGLATDKVTNISPLRASLPQSVA